MKKYLMGIFGLISFVFYISVVSAAQNGGGGNYSKDKACQLTDGMYSYNLQIENYPGYNTLVKNFVKEKGVLFYVINATPINEEDIKKGENFLWSWNCKTKKAKQLSDDLISSNSSSQVILDTTEIDYMNKNFIIARYKIRGNICGNNHINLADSNNLALPTVGKRIAPVLEASTGQKCSYNLAINSYVHVSVSRSSMEQSLLNFWDFQGYGKYKDGLNNKYISFSCYIDSMNKSSYKTYTYSEATIIPNTMTCDYHKYEPYIVDIKPKGNNATFTIKYGDGISGQVGYMDTIKVDLLSRTILQ